MRSATAVKLDPAKREAMEREIGRILFDNALTDLTYYNNDAIWPVCRRI